MALRFCAVPVHDSSTFEQQLNGFLASHRVVSIDRRLIDHRAFLCMLQHWTCGGHPRVALAV
jgi:hypothetical protein